MRVVISKGRKWNSAFFRYYIGVDHSALPHPNPVFYSLFLVHVLSRLLGSVVAPVA